MLYFIPAWYQNGNWKEHEPVWYRPRTVSEFDDTVKQIQLFSRNQTAPFKILILGFSPNFRHFLHRQGIYHAPYWSCFDAMQGVRAQNMDVFSFHDLTWPEDVEFIYSPFAVIAQRKGQKYAQIEFAEDGNMFRVDMFENNLIASSNLYDDRGFVSCRILYRDGAAHLEQYFDDQGTWKFARYLDDGHVLINPESAWFLQDYHGEKQKMPYKQQVYGSIEEMITEVFEACLEENTSDDVFIAAMHPLHTGVLGRALKGRKLVLSFFSRRLSEEGNWDDALPLMRGADYFIADKTSTSKIIREHAADCQAPMKVITPYDSRVDFGISHQLRVQNILLAVDQIPEDLLSGLAVSLAEYILTKNKRARVCLFTRSASYNERSRLLQKVQKILQQNGLHPELAREDTGKAESRLDEDGQREQIFTVAQCVDEMAVSRTLREQRVVVDLQALPDQFLQISAMSMGIPQITSRESDFTENGKNCLVVSKLEELPDALDYYLKNITNWNQAQIASYTIGSRFSTGKLVDAWKEVIHDVEHQGAAAGR
ncbi:MAG: accessory Sec system protein Asp1 [Eubacterium sp.]